MTPNKQTGKNDNLEPYRFKEMELSSKGLCQGKDNIITLISIEA